MEAVGTIDRFHSEKSEMRGISNCWSIRPLEGGSRHASPNTNFQYHDRRGHRLELGDALVPRCRSIQFFCWDRPTSGACEPAWQLDLWKPWWITPLWDRPSI